MVTDAKKLNDAVAAGTISKDDAHAQGSQLGNRQAELKQDIDALDRAIDSQAKSAPDTTSPSMQAIQEGLKAAAAAIHEGRAPQEAVNATINFKQGHNDQALSDIARETTALDQAHARLSAAADAAAGGHGSDRQALGDLQRLSTALRQLEKTTQAAVDGAQPADGKKSDQASEDSQKNGDQGKNTTTKASDPQKNAVAQLPAELGNAIDSSLQELEQAGRGSAQGACPRPATEQKAKRINALTRQRMPIARIQAPASSTCPRWSPRSRARGRVVQEDLARPGSCRPPDLPQGSGPGRIPLQRRRLLPAAR